MTLVTISFDICHCATEFGILGLGLSVIIPVLFRIPGKTKDISPSVGIAFVFDIGFVGFFIGRVVLGFISSLVGLKASFTVLLLVTAFASLLAIFRKVRSNKIVDTNYNYEY